VKFYCCQEAFRSLDLITTDGDARLLPQTSLKKMGTKEMELPLWTMSRSTTALKETPKWLLLGLNNLTKDIQLFQTQLSIMDLEEALN
jgi:hypothetical protein